MWHGVTDSFAWYRVIDSIDRRLSDWTGISDQAVLEVLSGLDSTRMDKHN